MHACVTSQRFPLKIIISPENEHDSKRFIEVIQSIKIKTQRRPTTRPLEVLADSAYDNIVIRKYLKSRAIESNIPFNIRNILKEEDLQDSSMSHTIKEEQ
nr:transposase [Methanolobus sp.]